MPSDMSKVPINTTKQHQQDPMGTLLGALGNPDGYIPAQEARGQQELVNSEVLPRIDRSDLDSKQTYTDLGFTFGEMVKGDDLFQHATLPEGWKREGSSHSMWSYLLDERGIRRVAIFYKAAFYDRDAFMRIIASPGSDWANGYIYQETETDLDQWTVLTEEEQAAAVEQAQKFLADAVHWGDDNSNPERLDRALEILDKAGVEVL